MKLPHGFRLRCAVALATVAALTGCNAIYDDEGDCSVKFRVKFRYDTNIKEADAFASQVNSVSLYLFDPADGHLVWSGKESGAALGSENYTMAVDVPPGSYDAVAWCHGLRDNAAGFTLAGEENVTGKSDLICRMERLNDAGGAYSDRDLHGLYHASVNNVVFPDTYGDVTLPPLRLTKNTNVLQIMLQHIDGSPLDKDEFDITVTDHNGLMNHDNSILSDENITYRPWSMISGETSMPDPDGRALTSVSAVIAELTMCRLMTDHDPVLTVTHRESDGSTRTVLSLPLIDYLLMVKGNYHRHYTDQQYLDYQDEYSMTFFLDANNHWDTTAGIYINSWRVMLQFTDI